MLLSEFWSSQASPGPPNGPPTVSVNWSSRPRSPCFINPLFLQPSQPSRGASHKRHRLKRSLRVRVSTESSFSLTPGDSEWSQGDTSDVLRSTERTARRAGGLSVLRRTAALVPTSEEEDEQMLGEAHPVSVYEWTHACERFSLSGGGYGSVNMTATCFTSSYRKWLYISTL